MERSVEGEEHKQGVIFFLLYKNGKFLLEKRKNPGKPYDGRIVVPGGKVELDEDKVQTVIREPKEERDIMPTRYLELDTYDYAGPSGTHYRATAYLILEWEGEVRNKEDSKAEDVWSDVSVADKLVTYVNDKYILVLARKKLNEEGLLRD